MSRSEQNTTHADQNQAVGIHTEPIGRITLRIDEVAAAVGVDKRTIERWRSAGKFPRPDVRHGKVCLWMPQTIQKWAENGGRP